MDFYYSPGTCAQATHIMLREAGLPFTPRKVDVFTGQLEGGDDFTTVNPNGYVPALVLGGGMLMTESAAILDWIATRKPSLMPPGASAGPAGGSRGAISSARASPGRMPCCTSCCAGRRCSGWGFPPA